MRRRGGLSGAARILTALLVAIAGAAAAGETALFSRIPGFRGGERLMLSLPAQAAYRVFTLADPPRVVVDFPTLPAWTASERAAGDLHLIGGLRFGTNGAGARLVVDLQRPARVARVHTEPAETGTRFILDLAPTGADKFAALAGWPETVRSPVPAPPAGAPEAGARIVVIDAGHGGADPGAISRGVEEKDLVLDYARALAAALDALPGLQAMMTRRGDEYLTLRERVAFAREAGAALFLSLHADALATGEATGASVYVLSGSASGREAAALSAAHDRAESIAGVPLDAKERDVARVLFDLARRRTDRRSRDLARRLVAALRGATPVLEGRALQSAGFRVLKSPDIPSALIELGFMSNVEDRARLLSPASRDAVVAAIAAAVAEWAAAWPAQ